MKRFLTAVNQKSTQVLPSTDHRVIGTFQKLFLLSGSTSPGSAYILPHGNRILSRLQDLLRMIYRKMDYSEVRTPILMNGHWDFYKDDMFVMEELGMKPMNCPAHCIIFSKIYSSKTAPISKENLPIRFADFSPLHRNEAHGTLSGLTRWYSDYSFKDDGHIFVPNDSESIEKEIFRELNVIGWLYGIFSCNMKIVVSTRPTNKQFFGTTQQWDNAETSLLKIVQKYKQENDQDVDVVIDDGGITNFNTGGAFYGPKIDVYIQPVKDGKQYQTATIQLDFQLPQRFDLKYTTDTQDSRNVVLIHRALLGSLERFFAIYMESINGRWPVWCSPRHCMVIPLRPKMNPTDSSFQKIENDIVSYAKYVQTALKQPKRDLMDIPSFEENNQAPLSWNPFNWKGSELNRPEFHVDMDISSETLNLKIRQAQLLQYNFIIVVGEKELQNQTISVRSRDDGKSKSMNIDDLRSLLGKMDDTFQ